MSSAGVSAPSSFFQFREEKKQVEKLENFFLMLFFTAIYFGPSALAIAITWVVTRWSFGSMWLYYSLIALGAFLLSDFCMWLADDDQDGWSLIFGWRQNHPKRESYGYQAD